MSAYRHAQIWRSFPAPRNMVLGAPVGLDDCGVPQASPCFVAAVRSGFSDSLALSIWRFAERLAQLRRFISSPKVVLMKLSILTIATAALIAASPAFAQEYMGNSTLGGTNCGSLTPQQCRAAEILRAQLMLQSARVYAAQPQVTAPSLRQKLTRVRTHKSGFESAGR
jgi:hypothetical protein